MEFFRKSGKRSYDLFSRYSFYMPGVGGMFAILGMFLLGALLGNILTLIITAVSPEFAKIYGMMLSYIVMFIPPMLYASAVSRRNEIFDDGYALDSNNFGQFNGGLLAILAAASTLSVAFFTDPVSVLLPQQPEWFEQMMGSIMKDQPLWVTLMSVSVFAPFFEEWMCRGMVLRGLLGKLSPVAAILISSAFFAVIHMNPWQAVPAFIIGAWFGFIYYKTGSLKLTMLMHMTNNTAAVLLSRIPALEEADTFMDAMGPWAYAGTSIVMFMILGLAVMIFNKIKRNSKVGNCDIVKTLQVE